ncbi:peptidoglycan editing factor PgeF [Enterocloster sp. OA13]|uniref:peptidoglycan editing factor PgeF n=1 Tax=Enterocloster TaxID=2719313 RepID=UPI00046F629C|nr:peptidoglycan editing factor PgeF [Lachnoclostridium pacaense]MCC2817942.1 peptidoglycan editing factor PgeF [Lachnoclostridium pacaense]MCC2875737.1 peptidoglycan editing factor PgeF [Lachnoclostridium pacaense]MCH1949252.1 peptidoglycan editing factor PgeF [Enterocloster sp. OA13]
MSINWIYKDDRKVFSNVERGGVPYLSFKALEDTGMVVNGFSTRLGGASKGRFATMNFSYSRKDDPADVLENFTRMADALGVERDRMVVSYQTHTTNVRRVTREDEGKGVIRERDYKDVDGLITDVPGITLVTFYADCVPLYLVDQAHRAIGLSHSGWRGTVKRMGQVTMDAMKEAFGTRPEDLTVCIGPSICRDCFEVGEEVAEAFAEAFDARYRDELYSANGKPGKYQLDLWKANEIIFREAGVPKEQIHTTNICTMCNSDYLFSHRRVGEERGNLAAFLSIR